jgi:hypothetical protein
MKDFGPRWIEDEISKKWREGARAIGPDPINRQRIVGVGRIADNDRAMLVMVAKPLTDDQLRALHDYLRGWKP